MAEEDESVQWGPVLGWGFFIVLLWTITSWPAPKILLAQVMVALGIAWTDSDQVTDGDKLDAVIGIAIGLIGAAIALQQYLLSVRQHDAEVKESKRRGKPSVVSIPGGFGPADGRVSYSCSLRIQNDGDRPIENIYWTVLFPHSDSHSTRFIPAPGSALHTGAEIRTGDQGELYWAWTGLTAGPVYDRPHNLPLATVEFSSPPGVRPPRHLTQCEYFLECRDGRFPEKNFGELDVSLLAAFNNIPDDKTVRLGDD